MYKDKIDSQVRRGNISTLENLGKEINDLMTVVQVKFINDSEKAEAILNKHLAGNVVKAAEDIMREV